MISALFAENMRMCMGARAQLTQRQPLERAMLRLCMKLIHVTEVLDCCSCSTGAQRQVRRCTILRVGNRE